MTNYWHELPQEEVDKILASKITIGELLEKYKQPDWCNYPDALDGNMGCWSLMDNHKGGIRSRISKDYCKDCECFNDKTEL